MLDLLSDCAPLLPQGLSSQTPPWSEGNPAANAWARGDLSVVGSAWESPPPPLVDLGSISTPAALSAPATGDADLYVIASTDASVVELGDRLRARGAHTLALNPGEGLADLGPVMFFSNKSSIAIGIYNPNCNCVIAFL